MTKINLKMADTLKQRKTWENLKTLKTHEMRNKAKCEGVHEK